MMARRDASRLPGARRPNAGPSSYFGGTLDAFLAALAAAAAFFASPSQPAFQRAILREWKLAATEFPLGLACKDPGVSDAPGVPGFAPLQPRRRGIRPPACPHRRGNLPQAFVQINATTGNIAIRMFVCTRHYLTHSGHLHYP